MWTISDIAKLIKDVPDFPKKGILFKDITPILENSHAFISLAKIIADQMDPQVRKLVAIESRGFILGAAVAQHLNVGLVLVRKKGKLPRETHSLKYDLEYGTDEIEIHKDALNKNEKIAVIDDVLATGGTAKAVFDLVKKIGCDVRGFHFLMEIDALAGRKKLGDGQVQTLIHV